MEQNFCSQCGNELTVGSIFCDNCGVRLGDSNNQVAATIQTGTDPKIKKYIFNTLLAILLIHLAVFFVIGLFLFATINKAMYFILPVLPIYFVILIGCLAAVYWYSRFFPTSTVSKWLVKIFFSGCILSTILLALNLIPFGFEFIFIDNVIDKYNAGNYFSSSDLRKVILVGIAIVLITMAIILVFISLVMKRWFKKNNETFKQGIKTLFKPKFNWGLMMKIIKEVQ